VLIAPGLGTGKDLSRADELTLVTSTDSQSLLATMHNTLHFDRASRPRQASAGVRLASMLLGGGLTLLLLMTARGRGPSSPPAEVMFFGGLVLLMALLCPVCHLHYFSLSLLSLTGLLALAWEGKPGLRLGHGLKILLAANIVLNVLPNLPQLNLLRDGGLAMYMALAVWAVALLAIRREKLRNSEQTADQHAVTGAAA